jgi:hypothetical protein
LWFYGVTEMPRGAALSLDEPRVGVVDRYGGSMPSGWTRFVLEGFDFAHEVVFPPDLDEGNLHDRFDVLILPDGSVPSPRAEGRGGMFELPEDLPESIPEEYRDRLGSITSEVTVPRLLEFMEQGGVVLAVGSSTSLAYQVGTPLEDHLVDEEGEPLASQEYYIPGSVVSVKIDHSAPIAHGMDERADVLFSRSPVFRLPEDATGVRKVGWYDSATPLRSGWAWGQHHLEGGVAVAEVTIGDGVLYLFGPRITFRGQPHGTFPLLFNGIYLGAAQEVQLQ